MNDHEFISRSLQESGPREPRILQILQTGDETWAVRFEQVDVEIELEPESRRLVFATEIGPVPAHRRTEIYGVLLNYGLMWRETGGLRMALEPEGAAMMIADLHCSQVTDEVLATVLRNIEERTLAWRELFTGTHGGEATAPPPAAPEYPMIQI